MSASAADRALLSLGVGLWGIVLLILAIVLIRLLIRAKAISVLRVALAADAARVAEEFEAITGDGETICILTSQDSREDLRGERNVGQRQQAIRRLRERVKGARSLVVEALTFPPRAGFLSSSSAPASTHQGNVSFAAGMNPNEVDLYAPVSLAKEDHGCCSICLEHMLCECEVRTLPCNHIFHAGCVGLWLPRAGRCPQCQGEVIEKHEKKEGIWRFSQLRSRSLFASIANE